MRDDVLVLEPVAVGGLWLRNRAVVAPMSRVSTHGDGVATPAMVDYYATFAHGGFALIITEGTYTDHAYSQAYANQPALVTDRHVAAWARVTRAVRDGGGRIFAQLMHAGALVQGNQHRNGAVAPSPVQPKGRMLARGYGGRGAYTVPRAMTHGDIAETVSGFAHAAFRARTAGFDGVEVHAANGYLLDQFLTPYTNLRTDEYGGSVANRVRLTVDVVKAIHRRAGEDFPVGVRVSQVKVNDPDHRWSGLSEAETIFANLRAAELAYIHVSTEDAAWSDVSMLTAGSSITGVARSVAEVPVIANGGLEDPHEAQRLLRDGHADLISLGRGALANPDWPSRLAEARPLEPYDPEMLRPEVTLDNTQRWHAARGLATCPG